MDARARVVRSWTGTPRHWRLFSSFPPSHRLCCRPPPLMQDVFQDSLLFFPPIILLLLLSGALSAGYRTRWCSQRRELVLSAVAAAALPLPPPPQMVLITRPLEPVLCQLVLAARLPPSPPPLFGGLRGLWGGCMLACMHTCVSVCVCARRWKDEEIVRRNWKDKKKICPPFIFFPLPFPAKSCATVRPARITKTHVFLDLAFKL